MAVEAVVREPVSEPGAWNTENRKQSDPALCAATSGARLAREDKRWRRRQSGANLSPTRQAWKLGQVHVFSTDFGAAEKV